MRKTMSKSIVLLLIYLLMLFSFTSRTTGCGSPDCGDCEGWNGEECVPYGDCWGGCPDCQSCPGCWCECTSECCDDSDCGPPDCWNCVNCQCEYQCDPAKCETCVDGSCKVCGGDPDKCCDNGVCVPKCTDTGQCSYEPPESNYATCENFNPTDKTCEDIIEGALCGHVIDVALNDAECAGCAPNCDKTRICACAEIIPVHCKTRCWFLTCACLCDDAGEPYVSGDHYECD